jgi:hypothetical protein
MLGDNIKCLAIYDPQSAQIVYIESLIPSELEQYKREISNMLGTRIIMPKEVRKL